MHRRIFKNFKSISQKVFSGKIGLFRTLTQSKKIYNFGKKPNLDDFSPEYFLNSLGYVWGRFKKAI